MLTRVYNRWLLKYICILFDSRYVLNKSQHSCQKRVSKYVETSVLQQLFLLLLFSEQQLVKLPLPLLPRAVKLFRAVCNLTMVPLWMLSGLPSHRELNGQFLLPMIGVQWNNTQKPGFISFTPKKWSQGTQAFISYWTICQPWWPQRFITKNQDPSCPLWNSTSHTLCECKASLKPKPSLQLAWTDGW